MPVNKFGCKRFSGSEGIKSVMDTWMEVIQIYTGINIFYSILSLLPQISYLRLQPKSNKISSGQRCELALWSWPSRQQPNLFARQSRSWWGTTIPSLVAYSLVVHQISSGQRCDTQTERQTDRLTRRQTNGQGDSNIPPSHLTLLWGVGV